MKKLSLLLFLAACVCVLGWFLSSRTSRGSRGSLLHTKRGANLGADATPLSNPGARNSPATNAGFGPSVQERRRMSDAERLRCLEETGRVPADADWKDWDLAGQTSWWGKPLDPKEFWRGKVVWLDEAAKSAAAVRGRTWPPIPYDEATLARLYPALVRAYPGEGDTLWGQAGLDSPTASKGGAYTSKERAFWCDFIESHPRPPEVLERAQCGLAEETLKTPKLVQEARELGIPVTPDDFSRKNQSRKQDFVRTGIPAEALSVESVFWAYVLNRRQQYQRILDAGRAADSLEVRSLLDRLLVETNYVTQPLADEQLRAANAWKIAYLQRLRKESTNEPYVNAYFQAWNLSAAQVFGGTNKP